MKTLCYCCPLNGCLWGKQVPFSSGLHTDTKGTHFLWPLVFAYTPPLSSCLLAFTSCQADREFMPTQWQVSDGKALCPKKTLRLLSLCVSALPPSPPLLFSLVSPALPSLCFSSMSRLFRDQKVYHLQWNIKKKIRPYHCVTELAMVWHLGPIWLTQLGTKCQLICPTALYIPCVCLPLSVTNGPNVAPSTVEPVNNHPQDHMGSQGANINNAHVFTWTEMPCH